MGTHLDADNVRACTTTHHTDGGGGSGGGGDDDDDDVMMPLGEQWIARHERGVVCDMI